MPSGGGPASSDAVSGGGEFQISKILFGRYEVGRLLGCGAFAKVYHARNLRSGHSVAIKIIHKPRAVRNGLSHNIRREISIMRRLRHPHVIRLLEVLASRSKIYFVLEFAKGGELFSRVAGRGRLPEDSSRRLFHQLVSAVGFCHARGVFHRDLKPENLLLDESGDLKISDFGLSAVAPDNLRSDGLLHTLCGTPAYVAPEILSKKGYGGAAVDLWSCGVILFVLNAGYLPFNDPNLMAMYRKIYRGEYRIPRWTSPELRSLISRLLDTNPETRITVDGVCKDPWFRKGLDEGRVKALMRFHEEIEVRISKIGEENEEKDRDMNAFDIIALASGFDLSGLLGSFGGGGRERLVLWATAEAVLERVEAAAETEEGMSVRRRGMGMRGGAAVEGRRGELVAWVEVYRLAAGLVVVEVERGGGAEEERRWSEAFWTEKLEPALKGMVASCSETEPDELVRELDPVDNDVNSPTAS